MSWQILITLQTLIVSLWFLSLRSIARQKVAAHAGFVLLATQSVVIYAVAISVLAASHQLGFDNQFLAHYFWVLVANGLLFGIGNFAMYKALTHLDAGFSSILNTLITVSTLIFANLILHEKLDSHQAIGAAMLLSAVVYTTLVAREHHKRKKNSQAWLWGLIFSLLACVPYGLAQVSEKYLLNHASSTTYITYAWGFQMLGAVSVALLFGRRDLKILRRRPIIQVNLLGALARGTAGFLFIKALVKSNSVSVISIVTNFRIIIIILLGALLLKERVKIRQKLGAAAFAIAGLSVIFWK